MSGGGWSGSASRSSGGASWTSSANAWPHSASSPSPPWPTAKKRAGAGKPSAFDRGLVALAQYRERTDGVTVPRQHIEEIEDGDGGTVEIKLGVWISNTKSRRAKLTGEQLDRLAALGLDWS
jgi:hypothetical protein